MLLLLSIYLLLSCINSIYILTLILLLLSERAEGVDNDAEDDVLPAQYQDQPVGQVPREPREELGLLRIVRLGQCYQM